MFDVYDDIKSNEDFLVFLKGLRLLTKNETINARRNSSNDAIVISLFKNIYGIDAPIEIIIDIVVNNSGVIPNCALCGGNLDFYNLSNQRKKVYHHIRCAKENRSNSVDWSIAVEKRKKTCIEKYGQEYRTDYDYIPIVEKIRKTKKTKYGDENYVNNHKARATKLERYGDENYRNEDKIKSTCLDIYGADNPFGSKGIVSKIDDIMELRYGGRGFDSPILSKKIEDTNTTKYGVVNAMQSKNISEKSSKNKKISYYGEELFGKLTHGIYDLYEEYANNNSTSLNILAKSIGIDSNTLSRKFKLNGFEILDRSYSCSTSYGEEFLCEILKSIDPNLTIIRNTRNVIPPKEIDIWLPQLNVGIEYHGSYWHSEDKVKDLHRDKAMMSLQKGIRLIQIFDFELIENREKIEMLLVNVLGKSNKKYARNCTAREIHSKESKFFLDENHLQGHIGVTKSYGLFDSGGNILQVMSFGKPRFSEKYDWEILRLSSKLGVNVVGGTQRLWKKFLVDNNPLDVISYADARFFTGGIYEKLGFDRVGHSVSDYLWFDDINTLTRCQKRKSNLNKCAKDITECQIMKNDKYIKIRDAGNHVFVYTNKN
jgi:very-short-patch-repair endonuclease